MYEKNNPKDYTFKTPEMVEKFYYTTDYPCQWTSGPTFHYFGEGYAPIKSIEEAKALAEAKYIGGYGDNHCSTTYGVIIECKVKEDK